MADHTIFAHALDRVIEEWSILKHPFYRSWNEGALSRNALKQYACQYYHFVKHFPRFLSATHMNTPDIRVRQEILLNLMDEEYGSENHPALWERFAEATGASAEQLAQTEPLPQTLALVNTFFTTCRNRPFIEGLGALYAYESQVPEVSRVKMSGLRRYYGITDAEALRFFMVHMEMDVEHSATERRIIEAFAKTAEQQEGVLGAAEGVAKALWRFLDGVYELHVKAETDGADLQVTQAIDVRWKHV